MLEIFLLILIAISIGYILSNPVINQKKMRIAIVGSRGFNDYQLLEKTLDNFIKEKGIPEAIISGGARGADTLAERYADARKIKKIIYPADWTSYGKAAGYIRNNTIIQNCDECFAFWDGISKGTAHDIKLCQAFNKPCHIIRF